MAFQQGLSGLTNSAKALDVIGNNVANAATVGFKGSNAHFADVYAASMQHGSALQIGIGTNVPAIAQDFTQGNLTTTNNPLDIAINGNGFFRMSNNGVISYTRNGQFHLDKTGYFINDQGLRLTGFPAASDGSIPNQQPRELRVTPDLLKLPPVATGASSGEGYQGVQASVNLDSRTTTKTFAISAGAEPDISPSNYNYSRAVPIYDSLGNSHNMTMYFVKTATPGEWQVYSNTDGTRTDAATDFPSLSSPITLTFDTNGNLMTMSGGTANYDSSDPTTKPEVDVSIDLAQVATNLKVANPSYVDQNATSPLTFKLSFEGTTQTGASFSTDRLVQDGHSPANLAGMGVSADGTIQGRYSNGESRNIGRLALASFQNMNGLANIGNNQWVETVASGTPIVDAPGTGLLGAVQSNAVEESSVDLTSELVKMITMQRNYQASAQTIKTQDQIMQTIVNLR